MKKLLFILAIIAMTTPMMAQTVDFAVTDLGGGQVQIGYANNGVPAADLPVGIALKVECTGCEIIGLVSYDQTEFPAYIDYAYTEETAGDGYDPLGEGQPLAENEDDPGRLDEAALGVGNNVTTVYVCMGRVQDGVAGPNPGPATVVNLVTLQLAETTGEASVTVSEDLSSRGGVVGGGDPFATNLPQVELIEFGCYNGPDQAEWEAVGRPASWCWDYQCHGDADDATQSVTIGRSTFDVRVSANDLAVLAACWQSTTAPDYAADFDHASQLVTIGRSTFNVRNSANDLAVLAFWWQNTATPGDCQTASPAPNE